VSTAIAGVGVVLITAAGGADAFQASPGAQPAGIRSLDPPPLPDPLGPLLPRPPAAPAAPAAPAPAWAAGLPADTTQVIRTVRSDVWCAEIYCTQTEAWEKVRGTWRLAAGPGRNGTARFRSTIGPHGFAAPGGRREGDGKSPSGMYRIYLTFSTTEVAPGPMPWHERDAGSVISSDHDSTYNTWMENGIGGDRPSMQYGFWLDYNHPRLTPGASPAPDPTLGSGIFYHTSWPSTRWLPTYGCTNVSLPDQMKWLLTWLRPGADPRVLNNI
jgi:L,D-peptidoglycan transpeptidase YkuD (ErfK/YbiS/YcfS/YnhG family)